MDVAIRCNKEAASPRRRVSTGHVKSVSCEARNTPGRNTAQALKQYSAEEKICIVLDGLRGERSIAELCRHEGIARKPLLQLVERIPGGGHHAGFLLVDTRP